MRHWWNFLSRPENQGALKILGAGFAALVVAAWTLFLYLDDEKQPPQVVVTLSDAQLAAIRQEAEDRIVSRYEAKLLGAKNDAARQAELRKLLAREKQLLQDQYSQQLEITATLTRLLSEAGTAITAPRQVLPAGEIDVARKQIEGGDLTAARMTLQKYSEKSVLEAARSEFLLGELAYSGADLESAAGHYRTAVRMAPKNSEYKAREDTLYQVKIVYESEMTDTAKIIAQVLSASKVNVRLDRWNDFKEDGDGYLGRWVSGPTFVFADSVPNEKITEYEAMIVQSGAVLDTISRHQGLLVKHGTSWSFGPFNVNLWLPNP